MIPALSSRPIFPFTFGTLLCVVTIQAAADEPASRCEDVDLSLVVAERITREGLLAGIAGDSHARDVGLRTALSIAPDYALARWHLAQIRIADQWMTIDQAEERTNSDPRHTKYCEMRKAAAGNPRRELSLAGWCRHQGYNDAEKLHLHRVLANASSGSREHRRAMDALGLCMYMGALLPRAEVEQLKARVAKHRKEYAKWLPVVERWCEAIENGRGRKQRYALDELRALRDTAAIPSLELVLSLHSEALALEGIFVLGNMPEYEATQSLVRHAVDSRWSAVRDAAVRQLQHRPSHDFVPLLLSQLDAPVQSSFRISIGADGLVRRQHNLLREGSQERHILTGNFVSGPQFVVRRRLTVDQIDAENVLRARIERAQQVAEAALVRKLVLLRESVRAKRIEHQVASTNAAIERENQRVFEVLEQTTHQTPDRTPLAWWQWWQDYNEVYQTRKPTYTHQVGRVDPYYVPWTAVNVTSCFPAGTKVRTSTGLTDIERIEVGDRVLSQDLETGELAYKLVLRTTERPPSELLRIELGDTTIVATKGHPFFVSNVGWRMAKRLQVGEHVHSVGGDQRIDGIEPTAPSQAYNLVVADFGTYFVSKRGVMVHDNTYRRPTTALVPGLLAAVLGDDTELKSIPDDLR